MRIALFDPRFFGPRGPAWHQLGQPNRDSLCAAAAFQHAGAYDVQLRPADEAHLLKIVRLPTHTDPVSVTFGKVGLDFVLVPPDELVELWDDSVGEPVETLGAVYRGRCLFITLQLPAFDVRGDPVENYLVLAHWMDPTGTTEVFQAPVRVVCQNTLRMAQSRATQRVTLTTGCDIRERMGELLALAVRCAKDPRSVNQLAQLANRYVDVDDVNAVLEAAYPSNDGLRAAARELFEGAGTGMDVPAARGTLWGLYNAVAELENFREGDTLEQAARSVLFGDRGKTIQRAHFAAVRASLQARARSRSSHGSAPATELQSRAAVP
jgi:hypothetical protein